jgi:hypothetical protein
VPVAAAGAKEIDSREPDRKPLAVEVFSSPIPVVNELFVKVVAVPVAVVEVTVNSLLVVSQPNPDASELILFVPLKKAICPEVPDPDTLEPLAQVPTLFDEIHKAVPEVAARLVKDRLPTEKVPVVPLSAKLAKVFDPSVKPKVPVLPMAMVGAVEVRDIAAAAESVMVLEAFNVVTPETAPAVVTFNPVEVNDKVPLELPTAVLPVPVPTLVAAPPEAFKFTVPVIVSPPVPCNRPDPEFNPTNTPAPA